ncbi:MAG: ABC transporter permease [Rhodobacteraceae bacterium]|nr:ABC transporter permease [Paracoccaceae bacterium]
MFKQRVAKSPMGGAITILTLIFHAAVRSIRRSHGNAVIGLLMNIFQTVMLVLVFYVMYAILGLRGSAIRGDFMLYIMSGIFMYMTHVKTLGAVAGSEGPTSPMMKHAPMNTIIAIGAAALGALYIQVLSLTTVLYIYHVAFSPITIPDPVGAFAMLLLAWFSGLAIGMVFLAIKPWFPGFTSIGSQIYIRANMIASGKMLVANATPSHILVMFTWNPLFHIIDQARGYLFLNYNPHYSSPTYPVYVALACLMIGLMGEFFTRQHASLSWSAKR